MEAASRLFIREVADKFYVNGLRICMGGDKELKGLAERLNGLNLMDIMKNNLKDMDMVSSELVR